jgi:hypothetical protein
MKMCAFCDAEATSGEHIWDNWINKVLSKTRYNAKKRLSLDSKPIQFPTKGLNEKLPVVCVACNTGWMSDLTGQIKDRFSKTILEGTPISLDCRDAVLLAAFTFMKAAVKDYCYGNDVFFTRAARERLRKSLTIPPLVKMWFAAYQGSSRYAFHSNFHIVSRDTPGPLQGMEFFSYTYILGQLTLQLLAPRWKDILHRGRPLVTLFPNAFWQPATVQFWPCAGDILLWPPEKYLGDSMIEKFTNRFQANITIPLR